MTIVQFPGLRLFGMRLRSVVFHSRYHESAQILTRIAVCVATLIWATIVLIDAQALERSLASVLIGVAPHWVYGLVLAGVALALLVRIWRDSRPRWIGVVGYGVILAAWLFAAIYLWLSQRPSPTGIATVSVMAGLALYAFLASPRPDNECRC